MQRLIQKAMVLAAGKGTRLGPLGETTPKCLVEAGGVPLLDSLLRRLKKFGVSSVVINTHHLANQVREHLNKHHIPEVRVSVSNEREKLLDTGGGVGFARKYFLEEDAFLVHNADIYTENVLQPFLENFERERPDAALLIFPTEDPRGLLFDTHNMLVGWVNRKSNESKCIRDDVDSVFWGFGGISILTPKVFEYMPPEGERFSIIDTFLEMARDNCVVVGYPKAEKGMWLDLGTPQQIAVLDAHLKKKEIAQKSQ
ncbi:MAG: NTP transferase domain-containing protein [Bdellovibrionales bacterium]|nr:NTP transferase domain-containing protein [Bdellovibrionales bacterium]